jgi:hypothetical protein
VQPVTQMTSSKGTRTLPSTAGLLWSFVFWFSGGGVFFCFVFCLFGICKS